MTEPNPILVAQADALCQDPSFREALWRHLTHRRTDGDLAQLRTRIHPDDQMLRHSLRHWGDANRSVSQYYGVALQQHHAARQLLALAHPGGAEGLAILDFACGWGRLLRFLTHTVHPSQVWASEIQADAVRFVHEEYGVASVPSAFDPDAFRPERSFDFIWVASLFSHLPDTLFRQWLARLLALLNPQGVLCFSVIGERLLSPNVPMPESGIHFEHASEIEELDNRAYGTTFVSEAYVRRGIAAAQGVPTGVAVRIRQGLANEQDIYVVPKDPGRDLSPLGRFRRGAWGWVDRIEFAPRGMLHLAGWAATLDEGPAEAVQIRVNGEAFEARVGDPREDVARVLGDARLEASGWAFERAFTAPRLFVEASARSTQGDTALLYAGWLGTPSGPVPGNPVAGPGAS